MNEFVSALQHARYELTDISVLNKHFLSIFTVS